MNRALATIRKLEKKITVSQFTKFKNPKKQYKPDKLINAVDVTFKLPAKWREALQVKAEMCTNGNLSEYLRQIIKENLKRNQK